MSALMTLSDKELLDLYDKAICVHVEKDFIELLDEELKRRRLDGIGLIDKIKDKPE